MTRDGIVRMALTAYPRALRDDRGDEIRATLLDATDALRVVGFLREVVALIAAGLRVRALDTARVGPARLVADGACLAVAWMLTRDVGTLLAQRVRGEQGALLAPWTIALAAVALALVLAGNRDRLGGAVALLWMATRTPALLDEVSLSAVLLAALVPVLCCAVLIAAPRRRRADPRRLLWLALPVLLAAALGPPPWEQNPILVGAVWLGALLAVPATALLLPADPRHALAGTIALTDLTLQVAGTHPAGPAVLAFAAAGPATIAVAALRTRRLLRPGR